MEKLKLRLNKKQLVLILFIAGCVALLAGIILFAVLVPKGRPGFFKTMLALIFGVMIVLGGWLLLTAFVHSRDTDAHFFRYDAETRRNIPVSGLTFDRVNRRLGGLLRTMVGGDDMQEIWNRNIFLEEDQDFGVNNVLAPLVAYKMLYDLARANREEYWVLFTEADRRLIESIAYELGIAGESRMPNALLEIYDDADGTDYIDNIQDFLTGNMRYLQRRMLEYARAEDASFF